MSLKQIALGFDQLANTLIGGMADETLSARAYRNKNKSKNWKVFHDFVNRLFFWQADHCYESYLSERARNQLPAEYWT